VTSIDAIERACARSFPCGFAIARPTTLRAARAAVLAACLSLLAACTTLPPARPIASPSRSAGVGSDARADAPSGDVTRGDVPRDAAALPQSPSTAPGGSNEAGAERGVEGSRAASNVLLERSRAAREAGSYDAAEASIERALRIAPNDPSLWLELAEIKLATDDTQQATIMARKAVSLAGGDPSISARAERLIDAAGR
jgi:tetratricopeptide (TPR) repeat protein